VEIHSPHAAASVVRNPPPTGPDGKPRVAEKPPSIWQRYWWAIPLVFLQSRLWGRPAIGQPPHRAKLLPQGPEGSQRKLECLETELSETESVGVSESQSSARLTGLLITLTVSDSTNKKSSHSQSVVLPPHHTVRISPPSLVIREPLTFGASMQTLNVANP